jgi:asparagine synthase (glutamine-hydrolysing)
MYERGGAPVDRALLQALTHSISYCGPDAHDTWVSGAIGFGHTMLRTTYESQNERQPAALDGQFWITADARIDCREELAGEIERDGNIAATGASLRLVTDSDLILRAYATWGEACVEHLRGDFVFAIWDARKNLLFCARDHFGVKPFYYAEPGELFLFSNILDCLRQHPDISGDLNDAAIGDFLLFGLNCDEATTTFREIRRLPAAHSMTVSADGLRMRRYWSAPTTGRIRYKRPEDFVEHFQILLQAAVADRLRADRVGILLSGGLDSATVATTARELSRAGGTQDLRAYTVVYESLIPDREGEFARAIAEFLKIPIRLIAIDSLQPFERWNDPELHWPEPVDDPFFAGLFDQFGTIAADCRVALSGEGSDNLMHFQMWPYVKSMVHNREWAALATHIPGYMSVRSSPLPGVKRRLAGLVGKDSTAPIYPKWLAPDFARRLNLEDRARQWSELPDWQPHPILPKAHASLSLPHWATTFEREHVGVTRSPVELRHPFLDLRIVNFLLAMPPFPYFFEKNLLREATVGRLPEAVRRRRKTPLAGAPLSRHLEQPGAKWLDKVNWLGDMDLYIDRRRMQPFQNQTTAEQIHSDIRPLCLNFWLQSMRKVRYNLRAEVRNA